MKKNIKKRVFSIILAVSAVLFSLPFQRVQAGTENPEAIQARLCTVFGESISAMKFGQFACLEFTLPQDLDVKVELCLPKSEDSLGCLYAVFYGEHLKNRGSRGLPDYEWKRRIEEEELRSELKTLSVRGAYEKAERIWGMGARTEDSSGESMTNYLIWKGQYVPVREAYPRYVKPGNYELRITPLDPGFGSLAVRIPLTVSGSGEGERLTQEDVQTVLEREEQSFPLEHMHVLDILTEHPNCRVDLGSGELIWREPDIPAGGEGELPFERFHHAGQYYNDKGLNIAGLGDLWTHSYSYFADIYRMDIMIYLPEGKILNFQKVYRKGWQCFGSEPYFLEEAENGFVLKTPEGEEISFHENGRAVRIRQADGSELRLSYAPDRLIQVSSDTDRLFFTYDKERLVKVTSDLGAKITFFYQGESGNVAESVSESGAHVRYEYDGKGQLSKVWDGAGDLRMEALYGEYSNMTGRAKAESLWLPGEDLRLTFSYDDSKKRNICRKKNGGSLAMSYEGNQGYEYETCTWMLFDEQGQLLRISDPAGKTTVY